MIRPSVVFCLEKMTVSRWLPISLSCLAGHLVHSLTNKCERLQGNTNGAIAPFLSVAMAAVKRLSLLYVLTLASKLYVCMSLVCTYSLLYMIVAKTTSHVRQRVECMYKIVNAKFEVNITGYNVSDYVPQNYLNS